MLKTTRAARLNRRRYLEIVTLLKEVIANEKAGLARRMKAADMLMSVYERHDRAQERKHAQNATPAGPAETTATADTPGATAQTEATDDGDAVTAARAFIAKLGNRAVHGEATHE